jgi:hypothetical protein
VVERGQFSFSGGVTVLAWSQLSLIDRSVLILGSLVGGSILIFGAFVGGIIFTLPSEGVKTVLGNEVVVSFNRRGFFKPDDSRVSLFLFNPKIST